MSLLFVVVDTFYYYLSVKILFISAPKSTDRGNQSLHTVTPGLDIGVLDRTLVAREQRACSCDECTTRSLRLQ